MQPKFKVGESVRFTGGTFTLTYPDKRVEYTLKGRVGVIKEVINILLSHSYRIDVEIDGKQRQVFATEKDLESGRIATPLGDKIEEILKNCPYLTEFSIDESGNYTWKFSKVAPMMGPKDLMKRLQEIGETAVRRAVDEMDRVNVRKGLFIEPIGLCLDPEHRGKIVFKKSESQMTKERCIKLLESYRAEREKVAKGRKFERCLRDSVVNEAIERAIELLKEGGK